MGSHSQKSQELGLDQPKARTQELTAGLKHEWQ